MTAAKDISRFHEHVQQRYREEEKPYRVVRFWDYVRQAEEGRKELAACTHVELLEAYESAVLDFTRYGRVEYRVGSKADGLEETNFIIMAYAAERAAEVKAEILRRMEH